MNKRPLNDRQIAGLKPRVAKQTTVGNLGEPGLTLTISPGGTKSFSFRYSLRDDPQKRRRVKVGRYPSLSLANAQKRAREMRVRVDNGEDPWLDRVRAKEASNRITIHTMDDLWEDYSSKALTTMRSADWHESLWRIHLRPALGNAPIQTVSRAKILSVIEPLRQTKSAALANHVQGIVSRVCSHGVRNQVFDQSPATNLGVKPIAKSRDRVLTEEELKDLLSVLDSSQELSLANVSHQMSFIFRLCLLTLCRRSEVSGALWSEINTREKLWSIGGERVKNGRTHLVPLSEGAIKVLENAKSFLLRQTDFVFQSPRTDKAIRGDSVTQACRRLSNYIGGKKFTTHDLRRTGATILTSEIINCERFIVSKLLNHRSIGDMSGSMINVYDRNEYLPQKREALNNLYRYLESLSK